MCRLVVGHSIEAIDAHRVVSHASIGLVSGHEAVTAFRDARSAGMGCDLGHRTDEQFVSGG